MQDDDELVEVPEKMPANDHTAKVMRWVSLLGGVCIGATAIAIATMD